MTASSGVQEAVDVALERIWIWDWNVDEVSMWRGPFWRIVQLDDVLTISASPVARFDVRGCAVVYLIRRFGRPSVGAVKNARKSNAFNEFLQLRRLSGKRPRPFVESDTARVPQRRSREREPPCLIQRCRIP
jgi:hypothetical protein